MYNNPYAKVAFLYLLFESDILQYLTHLSTPQRDKTLREWEDPGVFFITCKK